MKHTVEKSAEKLPELLAAFGCADVIAPVNADAFSRKAGDLISRNKVETVAPTAGKYRLRALQCAEVAGETRDPYAKEVLTVLAREFIRAAQQAEKSVGGKAPDES
jgi:hypothetical protein